MSSTWQRPKVKYSQGHRLLVLYDILRRGGKICAKEEAATFNTSRRTIERDLLQLKLVLEEQMVVDEDDEFGVSYHLNQSSKEWRITPWQILAVSVGVRVTGFLSGRHFASDVEPIIDQFRSSLLPGEQRRLKRLERKIHVVSTGMKDYRRNEALQHRLAEMLEGLLTEKPVELEYLSHSRKQEDKPSRKLLMHLLGATLHRSGMYFVGDVIDGDWNTTENRILLSLDRIQAATCCQDMEMFTYPSDFSAEKFFADAFAIWPNGKLNTIKVRIDADFAPYAKERFWHQSQSIKQTRDGGLMISLRVRGFEEAGEWVLSMGEHAEAVAPEGFREHVARRIREAMSKYDRC